MPRLSRKAWVSRISPDTRSSLMATPRASAPWANRISLIILPSTECGSPRARARSRSRSPPNTVRRRLISRWNSVLNLSGRISTSPTSATAVVREPGLKTSPMPQMAKLTTSRPRRPLTKIEAVRLRMASSMGVICGCGYGGARFAALPGEMRRIIKARFKPRNLVIGAVGPSRCWRRLSPCAKQTDAAGLGGRGGVPRVP